MAAPRRSGTRVTLHPWNTKLARRLKLIAGARSLREIAGRTGANSETVRRYIRDGNPCARFLARFCREFGVSADWILDIKPRSARATPRLPSNVTKVRVTLALSKNRVRVVADKPSVDGRALSPSPSKTRRAVRLARAPVPQEVLSPGSAPGPAEAVSPVAM